MRTKIIKILAPSLLLILTTVLVAIIAAGKYVRHEWTAPQFASESLSGIHQDGWIEEKAEVDLRGFSRFGNYIEFVFNPWRPAGLPQAQLAVSVCGAGETLLAISSKNPIRIGLKGAPCEPIRVSMRGLNSFDPQTGGDDRRLSTQLIGVRVSSRLGVPIASAGSILSLLGAVALLTFLSTGAFLNVPRFAFIAAIATQAVSVLVLLNSDVSPTKVTPLWIFSCCVLGGMTIWSVLRRGIGLKRGDATSEADILGTPDVSGRGVASTSSWVEVALVLAPIALGATLRYSGITFGLPANFHPDEVPKVNAIMRMYDQHTWNPQYFLHPSLLIYSTYLMNMLLQAVGIDGGFRDTAFLAGRLVSATAGTLSIGLTYFVARRLFSRHVAVSSALLLAVFPLHVTCSRYLKEDALLTFVVLSCVSVTILSVQSNRKWMLLLAGLLAGATAGAKYSGILMAVVPASAPWFASRKLTPDVKWLPWALLAVMITPLGFLATTPYALLDAAKFAKDFESESHHMQTGHTTAIDAWSQLWMYHVWRSIFPGMTPIAAGASLVGCGFLLRRARIEDLAILAVILLFYLPAEYVKAKPAPQPERYILPCLPFLAIALSEVARVIGRSLSFRIGAPVLAALTLVVPLSRSIDLASEIQNDTRDRMALWMKENVAPGSKVLMDWKPYCPRFTDETFKIEYIPRARIIPELDVRELKASGADYLVLSSLFYDRYFSQPESNPILRQRIREVFDRVPVVLQMAPNAGTYGFHNPVLTLFSLKQEDFARLDDELLRKKLGEISQTTNDVRAQAKW